MKDEEKCPIMIIFYFSKSSLLITETNEIDLDSMSGDMITFITVYYLNIYIAFYKNILKAVPVFILTSSTETMKLFLGILLIFSYTDMVSRLFLVTSSSFSC